MVLNINQIYINNKDVKIIDPLNNTNLINSYYI